MSTHYDIRRGSVVVSTSAWYAARVSLACSGQRPFSTNFQLSDLACLGYGLRLGYWVVFTIIASLTLTLTLITTINVILS